jgi:hypothetical protein
MELLNNTDLPFKEETAIVDVHAPAETYYTTGSNAGHAINRFRSLSVSKHRKKNFFIVLNKKY